MLQRIFPYLGERCPNSGVQANLSQSRRQNGFPIRGVRARDFRGFLTCHRHDVVSYPTTSSNSPPRGGTEAIGTVPLFK
jgi:hypothetical protein